MKASFLVSEGWQINITTTMFESPKSPALAELKTPEKPFTEEEMRIALNEMIDYMRGLSEEMEKEGVTPERKSEIEEELQEVLGHFKTVRNVTN
jgi:hypothetical protein